MYTAPRHPPATDAHDKKKLTERDICSQYVTPAITTAGWNPRSQVREQVNITKGRVIVRGKKTDRAERKFADYILYKSNIPLAVIEAKDNTYSVGHGMQQAMAYADLYEVPFVYSTNGDAFLEHDRTGRTPAERELSLSEFPSPADLWSRYCEWKGFNGETERIVSQDYHLSDTEKNPQYYQMAAINRAIEAIASGQQRILLVMATGTGKTYTAFQVIWRLWKSGAKKRILFLADRNILVDQTIMNDFKPFGNAMTKVQKRQADKRFADAACQTVLEWSAPAPAAVVVTGTNQQTLKGW